MLAEIICVSKIWYVLFLGATELRWCSKNIKNTSVSVVLVVVWSFLKEHGNCSIILVYHTYIILLYALLVHSG